MRISQEESRVTFVVRCNTSFGEQVRLVGNVGVLGWWDPHRGAEMNTSKGDHPKWRISITLPAGRVVEYKYVRVLTLGGEDPPIEERGGGVRVVWERLPRDRQIVTERGATMVVNDGEFGKWEEGEERCLTVAKSLVARKSQEKALHAAAERVANTGLIDAIGTSQHLGFDGEELIIVMYRLPIIAYRDRGGVWSFSWDDDALYLTFSGLRKGLEDLNVTPVWIGILNTEDDIPREEEQMITDRLVREFSCVPVFIPQRTLRKFYQGFCKGTLWPLFHMVNTFTRPEDKTTRTFDWDSWHTYQKVNRIFSKVVVSRYDKQLIWIHDYHLMLLPYYLRIKLSGVRIGFYLHTPWPSSEIFRIFPARNELLKGLLSATLLGFHLFDYARHFLSSCVRLLNLEHEARRGSLGIEYEGRHVTLRVSHIGVDRERFISRLNTPMVRSSIMEYKKMYPHVTILGAIDDLDLIKGIALKLIAFESYLASSGPSLRSKVALIQVAIPKAARVDRSIRDEIRNLVIHINEKYGTPNHTPVHYIEEQISFDQRLAVYSVVDALLLTPIRDGLNLIPYEYIVTTPEGKGQLILSEFTGCSRALSSAVRVNPWNVHELRDVIDNVVQRHQMGSHEVALRHKADIKYVSKHNSAAWAESFLHDLNEASEATMEVVRLGLGAGLGSRRLEFEELKMLNIRDVLKSYRQAKRALFVFDYDGTLTTIEHQSSRQAHVWSRPTDEITANLEELARVEKNTVVIMSGRKKEVLEVGFLNAPNVGIAAEHGFYYREAGQLQWNELLPGADLSWIDLASRIMADYTERTDGSYIEEKTAGLVWHYLDADPEFGGWQSKEMHDHLESLLAPFNVQVVNGQSWLQVRLANVNKGKMVEKVLSDLGDTPDFVLCCGDDRTDEDMFNCFENLMGAANAALYTCTVGVKPSNARYYLRGSLEVAQLITQLVETHHEHEQAENVLLSEGRLSDMGIPV